MLFARSLMEDDLPARTYVSGVLERIHKEAEAAYEALSEHHLRSVTAAEPPAVATASEEEKTEDIPSHGTPAEPDTREPYTLARVVEMVRGHAKALRNAGTALDAVEDGDPMLFALVAEQAHKAAEELWGIENDLGRKNSSTRLYEEWHEGGEALDLMQRILWALPLLELAAQAARSESYEIAGTVPWLCCSVGADQVSKDLTE